MLPSLSESSKAGLDKPSRPFELAAGAMGLALLSPTPLPVEVFGSPCMTYLPCIDRPLKTTHLFSAAARRPQPAHGRIPTRYAARVITSPSPTSRSSEMNPGRRTR
jgi:hypothetical protein